MQEEWRVIDEFPNYSISNAWKVRNDNTGKLLKISENGVVNLSGGNRSSRVSRSVHKLYLKAFGGYSKDILWIEDSYKITCCSDCPYSEKSLEGCRLYSYGCVDRYHYKEYYAGRPSWCEMSPKVKEK